MLKVIEKCEFDFILKYITDIVKTTETAKIDIINQMNKDIKELKIDNNK